LQLLYQRKEVFGPADEPIEGSADNDVYLAIAGGR
jgi:hypothetical protein